MIQPAKPANQVENDLFEASAALGAAADPENGAIDTDLSQLVELWPFLCEDTQRAILDLVRR